MAEELIIRCGNEVIADGDPFSLGICEEYSLEGGHALDVVPYILAATPTVLNRITKDKEIRIAVFRQHASYAAALEFAHMHDEALPGKAHLEIELTEAGLTTTLQSKNCGWEGVTQDPVGVSTITEYRVIRGAPFTIATSDPEEPAGTVVDAGTYDDGYGAHFVFDGGSHIDLPEPANSPAMDAGNY